MISWKKVIISQTVNATASVESDPIRVADAENIIGVKTTVESGTAPEVQTLHQAINSGQGDADLVGGAEDTKNGIGWVTPETGGTIFSTQSSDSKIDGHTIMPSNWIRIQVKGINDNSADTVVSVWAAIDDCGTV